MMVKTSLFLILASPLALTNTCQASSSLDVHNPPVKVHGVSLPSTKEIEGQITNLNGHGLRRFSFYGMEMDMYVAGLYSFKELRNEEDGMEAARKGPLCFDFVFLRDVSRHRMRIAWRYQMSISVTHHYEGYEEDRELFLQLVGSIDRMGIESVQMIGDDTIIMEKGQFKGRIVGRDFQKAFLSMWFGRKAVTADLKAGLLGTSHPEFNKHHHHHHSGPAILA